MHCDRENLQCQWNDKCRCDKIVSDVAGGSRPGAWVPVRAEEHGQVVLALEAQGSSRRGRLSVPGAGTGDLSGGRVDEAEGGGGVLEKVSHARLEENLEEDVVQH